MNLVDIFYSYSNVLKLNDNLFRTADETTATVSWIVASGKKGIRMQSLWQNTPQPK